MIRALLFKRPIWLVLIIAIFLLSVVACNVLQGQSTLGNQTTFAPDTEVVVACTDMCAQNQQCGTRGSGDQVVFASIDRAATGNHTYLIPHNSTVTVRNRSPQQLVGMVNRDRRVTLDFYQVTLGEQPIWVAGWCVADRAQ